MRIALDYDDTYTADPILWDGFVSNVKERGHEIAFVTFRSNPPHEKARHPINDDIFEDAERLKIDVVFSSGQPKRKVYNADIWIDDLPELIPAEHVIIFK